MSNEKDPFGTRDVNGWYEWKGDDLIRPAGYVEVIYRNGLDGLISAEKSEWIHDATHWEWDIVKWRPAQ